MGFLAAWLGVASSTANKAEHWDRGMWAARFTQTNRQEARAALASRVGADTLFGWERELEENEPAEAATLDGLLH